MQTSNVIPKGNVAAALHILATNGAQEVLRQIIPQFERASACTVSISFGSAKQLLARIAKGETADLYMCNASTMDDLQGQDRIVAASRRDLTRCGIGIAVRAGAPKPDIESVEALRRTLLDAGSVAYTAAASSGVYFAGVIERLGIAAQVRAKARTRPDGLIGELLVSGEAELAVQHIPELLAVPGIDLVGPLPPELQTISLKTVSVVAASRHQAEAQALLQFLFSAPAAQQWEACGYEMCEFAPT